MKTLMTLIALISLATAFIQDRKAFDAIRVADSAREQLEAYTRTNGRHIDSAYICRSK